MNIDDQMAMQIFIGAVAFIAGLFIHGIVKLGWGKVMDHDKELKNQAIRTSSLETKSEVTNNSVSDFISNQKDTTVRLHTRIDKLKSVVEANGIADTAHNSVVSERLTKLESSCQKD